MLNKKLHECEENKKLYDISWNYHYERKDHFSPENKWHGDWGVAVDRIVNYNDEEYWWASNGEYATMIQYCPFCGIDLTKKE